MSKYNLDDLGTFGEWKALGEKYKKPRTKPAKKLKELTAAELKDKVVVVYSKNTDRDDRDYALVRAVGSSTPSPDDFWVSGANEVLDAK